MSLKSLTTGIAAAATVGAAALGVISLASATEVVLGATLPQASADNLPSTGELTSILTQLADPNLGFHSDKSNLVEGGIGIIEGKTADRLLQSANKNGSLPLVFNVSPPTPAGDNAVSAVVAASGLSTRADGSCQRNRPRRFCRRRWPPVDPCGSAARPAVLSRSPHS